METGRATSRSCGSKSRTASASITIDNPPVNALGPGVRDGIVEAVEKGEADPKRQGAW